MMGTSGWQFFLSSWRMSERSAYESGLPGVYLLKGTMLAFVALVSLQGIAIACRCLLTLLGHAPSVKTSAAPEAY
jgi:TRAP-type mannitol/chloroaromatic compound transport system permease small subunit